MRIMRRVAGVVIAAGIMLAGGVAGAGAATAAQPVCDQSGPYWNTSAYDGIQPGASFTPPSASWGYSGMAYNCWLQRGHSGEGVRQLQRQLNWCNGKSLAVDGVFGAATQQALKEVQASRGITADGIYGDETRWRVAYRATTTQGYVSCWRRF